MSPEIIRCCHPLAAIGLQLTDLNDLSVAASHFQASFGDFQRCTRCFCRGFAGQNRLMDLKFRSTDLSSCHRPGMQTTHLVMNLLGSLIPVNGAHALVQHGRKGDIFLLLGLTLARISRLQPAQYPAEEDLYALFRYDAILLQRKVSSAVWLREPLPLSTLRRRKVKQAGQHALVVRESGQYDVFWEMLSANLKERHNVAPVHTVDEMRMLVSRFPRNIRLFGVYAADGAMLAGAVIYETARVAHVQYIASTAAGRACGALDLLFSHLIGKEFAGKEYFDFGNSVEQGGRYLNKGLIFQKEGFGARAVVYDTYEVSVNKIIDD